MSAWTRMTLAVAAGYGNPELADGPESFRNAYRHIIDICRAQGANHITWFFHVDVGGSPRKPWNRNAIRDVAARRWPRVRALSYWHERWRKRQRICIRPARRFLTARQACLPPGGCKARVSWTCEVGAR